MLQNTEIPGIMKSDMGYLINADDVALKQYKLKKQKNKDIENIKDEIREVKSDLNEIKLLLLKLSEK